eukprot:CAMPEP_0197044274 /NCGR_PEP_ID=MMETSP1384-20130603/20369_1 /TAXON_ID=29189 /ORGANISM="Ammonia sp." /LENGTH=323 /DNA_ID=CAMNT_0042475705 /DNA_START=35 /DNA_END=1006 /DNA_ORIENTATION=-
MRALTLLSLALFGTICNSQKYRGELDLVPNIAGNPQTHVEVEIDFNAVSSFSAVQILFTVQNGGVWNGIGFGTQAMNGTYAIILDYDQDNDVPVAFETILGHHEPGSPLSQQTISVLEDTFVDPNGRRVRMERDIFPDSNEVYVFPESPPKQGDAIEIPMIAAVGPSWDFFLGPQVRHSQFNREAVTLVLLPVTNETTQQPTSTVPTEERCCDCLEINNFGRCFNQFGAVAECENLICTKDEYCCTNVWDSICVQQASAYCEGTPQPQCCACTIGQGGQPGCPADPACEATICGQDPYCCGADGTGYWDKKCVNQAYQLCGPQ